MARARVRLRGGSYAFAAGLAAMVAYGAALASRGIYPFGGRSVLLFDMGNQYAVFHAYLHQVLMGKASPLFSWRVDLGMNFLPVFGYYLASPFSLLVLLFPDQYIPEAMVLIMLLKIGTGAGCMSVLLRRISACPKPVAAVFGATYAVGAWTVAYGFNVMWLDVLYLLPLALLAVERLLATGRMFRLGLVLAAAFLVNFYDAALILPFVALYLPARKVGRDRGVRPGALVRVCLQAGAALAIGVAASGVLLFPVLMGIIHGRTAILGTDQQPVPVPWTSAAGGMFGGSMDWTQNTPHFGSTSAVLVIAALFPFARSIGKHERFAFSALALLLALGSQNIDVYTLWHAAEKPNGFPYRYTFLLPAVFSIMACMAWGELRGRRATVLILRAGALWLAALTVASIMQHNLVTPGVFALAGISLLLAAVVFALIAWNGNRKPLLIAASVLVLADATGSAILEASHIPYPYRSLWSTSPVPDWNKAMSATAPSGSAFDRTESVWPDFNNGYKLSHNASLRTGAYELNHFSSMSSGRLHDALTGLGFTHYVTRVWVSDTGSTLASDAFLGMTRFVAPGPLSRADITQSKEFPTARVYQNSAALSGGFVAQDFEPSTDLPKLDPFAAQSQLLGSADLFDTPCSRTPTVTGGDALPYIEPKTNRRQLRVVKESRARPVTVTWTCQAKGPAQVYAWADTLLWDGAFPGKGYFHVRLNDQAVADYPNVYDNGIHDFGTVQGGTFTIELTTKADSFALPLDFVRSLDVASFNDRIQTLRQSRLQDVRVGNTSFDATADAAKDGTVVIAVPFIYGWTAKVDDHETGIQQVDGAFMGIPVTAGRHHISLSFSPPGLNLGLGSSAVGFALLLGIWWFERRRARLRAAVVSGLDETLEAPESGSDSDSQDGTGGGSGGPTPEPEPAPEPVIVLPAPAKVPVFVKIPAQVSKEPELVGTATATATAEAVETPETLPELAPIVGRPPRSLFSRRGFLVGGAAVTGTAAVGIAAGLASSDDQAVTGEAVAQWAPMSTPGASFLHVVAHPDDDLYFFNPDLEQAIRSGAAVTSVVLTAAEDDGKNLPRTDPGYNSAPVDFAGYAAARAAGLRAAYAFMATADRTSAWNRETIETHGGGLAELATLAANPKVRLVFLNMRSVSADHPGATLIGQLWEGALPIVGTRAPTGSPVTAEYSYSRDDVIATLHALMVRFKPTVVRTMDPDPEQAIKNPNYIDLNLDDYADHGDHIAAGLFAHAALQRYQDQSEASRVLVESYRGYGNQQWPHALGAVAYRRKLESLAVYGGSDGYQCPQPGTCADLKVGAQAPSMDWGRSTNYRYPGSTTWLRQAPDGRLYAFGVLGGQAAMWYEHQAGSNKWHGPVFLAGRPMAPELSVVLTQDGRFQLFALAMTLASAPADQYRPVMTAVQTEPDKFSAWASIGTPNFDAPTRRSIGAPTAALGTDGLLRVYSRNWGHGLSGCQQSSDGVWGGWVDLGGLNLQDGVFALDRIGGSVELFASSQTTVTRWRDKPGQDFVSASTLPMVAPAGPVTAVVGSDGRCILVTRQTDTGWVVAYRETQPGGDWDPTPLPLGGHGGFGPVAGVAQGGDLVLAQRNDAGTVSFAWVSPDFGKPVVTAAWTASGPLAVHMPAVALAHDGNVVGACLGPDGKLYVTKQKSGVKQMGAWKAVG